jgi:flagellin
MTPYEMGNAFDVAIESAASIAVSQSTSSYHHDKLYFASGDRAKLNFTSMTINNGSQAGVNKAFGQDSAGNWSGDTFELSSTVQNLGSDGRRASNGTYSIGYSSTPADHVPAQEPAVTTTNTVDRTPAISTVASANDTITLNAEALAAGFTLTLESGITVLAAAGGTTADLVAAINAGTGTVKGSAAVAGDAGHGYTASATGDVITLTAVGAITESGGVTTAAGSGTMAGVAVSSVTEPATNDTITMNAEALAQGFTLTLESGVTVTATAGETTQQLADKINLGTGTETGGGAAPASHNGHGYTAAVSGDVITLTAAGAITGGVGADGSATGTSTAAGGGTMAGVAVSLTPKTTVVQVSLTAGMTPYEMGNAFEVAIESAASIAVSQSTSSYHHDKLYFASGDRAKLNFNLSYETSAVTLGEAAAAAAQVAATATADSIAAAATAETANLKAAETDAALANAGTPEARAAALQAAATAEAANEAANEAIAASAAAQAANEAIAASAAAQAAAKNAHHAEIEAIATANGSGTDAKVNALSAIRTIDAAIQTVNIQRSKLGAVSNRLSHTINNLTNISSNLSAAQGGIEDADFAKETTDLAKNQILQQASTAMLAQANASKQNVLSLLQG